MSKLYGPEDEEDAEQNEEPEEEEEGDDTPTLGEIITDWSVW